MEEGGETRGGTAVAGPALPMPLVVVIPLGISLTLAGVVLNLSWLAGWFEGADVSMGGPVQGNDVVVICFVKEGSKRVEFAVVEHFPYAICDRAEPFGPRSADPFCEDGDSSSVLANACQF